MKMFLTFGHHIHVASSEEFRESCHYAQNVACTVHIVDLCCYEKIKFEQVKC